MKILLYTVSVLPRSHIFPSFLTEFPILCRLKICLAVSKENLIPLTQGILSVWLWQPPCDHEEKGNKLKMADKKNMKGLSFLYFELLYHINGTSLEAQLVKNPPAMWLQFDPWVRKIPWRRDRLLTSVFLGFLGGSDGKEFTCNARDWVRSLGWEDLLEEGMATHLSIFAWRIPIDRKAWRATWGHKERYDWAT